MIKQEITLRVPGKQEYALVLRLALAAGGLGMMIPGALTDVSGLGVVAVVIVFQYLSNKKAVQTA